MSTAFTTITDATDCMKLSIVNEVRLAFIERWRALMGNAATPPAIFTEGQDATLVKTYNLWLTDNWAGMQYLTWWMVENVFNVTGGLYRHFYNHTEGLPEAWAGVTTGSFSVPIWSDGASFFASVGLSSGHFRRATSYDPSVNDWTDPSDSMYLTPGFLQVGDIYGPWIIDDFQKLYSGMLWTFDSPENDHQIIYSNGTADIGYGHAAENTWALAKTNAAAAYTGPGAKAARDAILNHEIIVGTWGKNPAYPVNFGAAQYGSHLELRLTDLYTAVEKDIHCFFFAKAYGVWDAQGFNVADESFHEWDSALANSSATFTSAEVCDGTAPPNWCAEPSASTEKKGWEGLYAGIVMKWNFTNA